MPFETVTIQIQKNGDAAQSSWRDDMAAGSVVTLALSDVTGVNTRHWWLVGRPEGSSAGGAGAEPVDLGTFPAAAFVVDIEGTYTFVCDVNYGAPNATRIRGAVAYLESITDPLGRDLRLLGPQETDEDIADPLVRQGWIKMLNRWLRTLANGITGVCFHDVRARAGDPAPADLKTKLEAGANVTITDVTTAGVQKQRISASAPGTDAHDVKATTTDANPDFLDVKLLAGTNISITPVVHAGQEKIQFDATAPGNSDIASWDPTLVRYFFIDPVAGNDANLGYIDAAPGTTFTTVQAQAVAVKTTSRLEAIRPHLGAGRMLITLFKTNESGGAPVIYDHVAGDSQGRDYLHLLEGYSMIHSRGSADLTNSTADRTQQGMITAYGPYTVASAAPDADGNMKITTVEVMTPTAETMGKFRLRIEEAIGPTTLYAAPRWGDKAAIPDTHVVTLWALSGATPQAGDLIYFERPGVKLYSWTDPQLIGQPHEAVSPNVVRAAMEADGGAIEIGCHDTIGAQCYYANNWMSTLTEIVGDLNAGVYVDETGDSRGNQITRGFAIEAVLLGSAPEQVDLSRCWIKSASQSQMRAPKITVVNCSFNDLRIRGGDAGITISADIGDLEMITAGDSEMTLRTIPDWINSGLTLDHDNEGTNVSHYLDHFEQLWGSAFAAPAIIVKYGAFQVILHHGEVGTYALDTGTGMKIYHDQAETISQNVSWESLRVTGFEVIGAQKIIGMLTSANYVNDTLPCPRGVPMPHGVDEGSFGGEYVGTVVGTYAVTTGWWPINATGILSSGYKMLGVLLTNCESGPPPSVVYAIVGSPFQEAVILRKDAGSGFPSAFQKTYLSSNSHLSITPTSGTVIFLGVRSVLGPSSGNYVCIHWSPTPSISQNQMLPEQVEVTTGPAVDQSILNGDGWVTLVAPTIDLMAAHILVIEGHVNGQVDAANQRADMRLVYNNGGGDVQLGTPCRVYGYDSTSGYVSLHYTFHLSGSGPTLVTHTIKLQIATPDAANNFHVRPVTQPTQEGANIILRKYRAMVG